MRQNSLKLVSRPPKKNSRSAKKTDLDDAEPVVDASHGGTVNTAKLDHTKPVGDATHIGIAPVKPTKVGRIEPIAVIDVFSDDDSSSKIGMVKRYANGDMFAIYKNVKKKMSPDSWLSPLDAADAFIKLMAGGSTQHEATAILKEKKLNRIAKPPRKVREEVSKQQLTDKAAAIASQTTAFPEEDDTWKSYMGKRLSALKRDFPESNPRCHMKVVSIEYDRWWEKQKESRRK